MAIASGSRQIEEARSARGGRPVVLVALSVAVLAAVIWEWLVLARAWENGGGSSLLIIPPSIAVVAALLWARGHRGELTPHAVVALGTAFSVAFLIIHRSEFAFTDRDMVLVYPHYGQFLLDTGNLPVAEYPPGALLLFAAGKAVGNPAWTLPLLTLPLLATAWYVLAREGSRGPWLVACIALLPALETFWEVKYDAVPAAFAVLGLVVAARERWLAAGLLFGVGAATKWWPALPVLVLAASLLRRRERKAIVQLVAAALVAFVVFHLPFIGEWHALKNPYSYHAKRGLMAESLPFLPLHFVGLAEAPSRAWSETQVPGWVKPVDLLLMVTAIGALTVGAYRRPDRTLQFAAATPVAFLLLNRVFSPQYLLPVAAMWVTSLVLHPTSESRERIFLGLLVTATVANWWVWPSGTAHWIALQTLLFLACSGATFIVLAAAGPDRSQRLMTSP